MTHTLDLRIATSDQAAKDAEKRQSLLESLLEKHGRPRAHRRSGSHSTHRGGLGGEGHTYRNQAQTCAYEYEVAQLKQKVIDAEIKAEHWKADVSALPLTFSLLSLLLTVHCSLHSVHCPVFTAHCSLLLSPMQIINLQAQLQKVKLYVEKIDEARARGVEDRLVVKQEKVHPRTHTHTHLS